MLCVCLFVLIMCLPIWTKRNPTELWEKNISNNETVSMEKLAGAWKGGKELEVFSI